MPVPGDTRGWRGPERIWPGRGGETGCAGRAGAMGNDGTFGATGSGCFGGAAEIGGAIGGEMGPPDAKGGRSGAIAFGAVTVSAASAAGSTGFGGATTGCAGRTGGAGAGGTTGAVGIVAEGATTGGRIAIGGRCITTGGGGGGGGGTAGGVGSTGSSSKSPPLRSACGSSSIRYRATLGSSFKWLRMRRARSSSIELEWVFLSWTPRFGSASMIALGLTSSSLASSLIRILLIDGEKN